MRYRKTHPHPGNLLVLEVLLDHGGSPKFEVVVEEGWPTWATLMPDMG